MGEPRHMAYVGPARPLEGLTALVRDADLTGSMVLAQFDFNPGRGLVEAGDGGPLNHLCFGWHAFHAEDFEEFLR